MSESKHIVCPNCSAINRLPAEKLAKGPKCGKCGDRIFTGKPIELTDQSFERHVSRSDIPVVVDFWAEWCGPCKMIGPIVEDLAAEQKGRMAFGKLKEAKDVLAELGWSFNDFVMLDRWFATDPDRYSTENLVLLSDRSSGPLDDLRVRLCPG